MKPQALPEPSNVETSADKKPWTTPEVRDQTIKSLTEGKIGADFEPSPETGQS